MKIRSYGLFLSMVSNALCLNSTHAAIVIVVISSNLPTVSRGGNSRRPLPFILFRFTGRESRSSKLTCAGILPYRALRLYSRLSTKPCREELLQRGRAWASGAFVVEVVDDCRRLMPACDKQGAGGSGPTFRSLAGAALLWLVTVVCPQKG